MLAALAGDDAAYRQVLSDLAAAMRLAAGAALRRAGQGNADTEDIVQETLLAVHLKRDTWDRQQPLGPWVQAILRHKVIDRLRRRGVRKYVELDAVADELVSVEPERGAALDVTDVLMDLDERARDIVRAMAIDGFSAAEVAARLGMREGAVRVALHRALKKLAAIYRRDPA